MERGSDHDAQPAGRSAEHRPVRHHGNERLEEVDVGKIGTLVGGRWKLGVTEDVGVGTIGRKSDMYTKYVIIANMVIKPGDDGSRRGCKRRPRPG